MTRKDFELIADVLSRTRAVVDCDPAGIDAVRLAAQIFASELAAINPRFDRPRFLDACGVPR